MNEDIPMKRSALFWAFLILIVWLAVISFWVYQANAATFYVDNTCSTNGNGTTSTCGASGPWNDLKYALQTADCSGMSSGDILEVNGDTVLDYTCQKAGTHCYFIDNANIEGACHDIIIQNKANTHVVVNGSVDIKSATWAKVGCGVYKCTNSECSGLIGSSFASTAWYDTGTGAGEKQLYVLQTSTACDDSLPAGYMTVDTTDQTACVHLADGSNPANADYFRVPWYKVALGASADSADNITLRKNPAGGSFTFERYRRNIIETDPAANTGWVVDGINFLYTMDRCMAMSGTDNSAGTIIKNNTFQWCGQEAIRIAQDSGAFLVENNLIMDTQALPVFERCNGIGAGCESSFTDNGTGIRIVVPSSGGGGIVRGNTILRTGGGNKANGRSINVEHNGQGITIDRNYIADSVNLANEGNGIIFTCDFASNYIDNVVIKNNRIYNVDNGIHIAVGSSCSSQSGKTNYIYNNTIVNAKLRGLYAEGAGSLNGVYKVQNNVIAAQGSAPTNLVFIQTTGSTGWTDFQNNMLECDACTSGQTMISWKGNIYKRDGDCTPGTNCIEDMSALGGTISGNDYGNINLNLSGTYPSLKIIGSPSIAIDAGLDLTSAGVVADYLGTARPYGSAYDVGAHEYTP